ncbi:MAG: aldehyde dehydrogenase (NADP(+)) [Planctomycetes bacterium]|nr:aldehyde dehydrogenase (NADP(+)) [Planctomycetota bacterium]
MALQQVLIAGNWRDAHSTKTFRANNPATKEPLADEYPVSSWDDCDAALEAAAAASVVMRGLTGDQIAIFLEAYADRIEQRKDELVELAHVETALPEAPRLGDVELPRTTNQLRLAAAAARDGSWANVTIDTSTGIRSCLEAIGPVCVFGPNNFPFAFGSISGGDFAAAIAAGNPVIAKANSSHPGTTRIFAEEARAAAQSTGMPAGIVQLIYRTGHDDGERLIADSRNGAVGYTGSQHAGLKLKAAADAVGKPIYLELSSINPVVILPGVLEERGDALADEFAGSCLMGAGQFCTNPGLVVLLKGGGSDSFVSAVAEKFSGASVGTLLSSGVEKSLAENLAALQAAGAENLTPDATASGNGYCHANTLLRVEGSEFLKSPASFQAEAFGNASLLVIADDVDQVGVIVDSLEGNLTGCIYSESNGKDDAAYDQIAPRLRVRVGRLLNDKMPTGVAVSPAMNHGGPFPATGHPGVTAVGIPASLIRFAMLQCYDNVRPHRLPANLRDKNPTGKTWRMIDGAWSQGDVG